MNLLPPWVAEIALERRHPKTVFGSQMARQIAGIERLLSLDFKTVRRFFSLGLLRNRFAFRGLVEVHLCGGVG